MVLTLFSLILVVTLTGTGPVFVKGQGRAVCSEPIDVVFLVDGANSIYEPHFELLLTFLQTLAGQFDISASGVRIAALGFGDGVKEYFPFGKLNSADEVKAAIANSTRQIGEITDTKTALEYAKQKLFKKARPGVPKVIIVTTDGLPQRRIEVEKAVNETTSCEIAIIVLAITNLTRLEFARLVSQPFEKFLFTVKAFTDLNLDVASKIATQACEDFDDDLSSGPVTSSRDTSSSGPVTSSADESTTGQPTTASV